MKLSLLSFNIGKDLELPELLKAAHENGFVGVELRCQLGHKHGVELDLDDAARQSVRDAFDDNYVDIAGLTVSNRFQYPDKKERQASVDEVKRYIELAADLDAGRVRVFGNDMPAGVPRSDVIQYVGESLRELGEFAEDFDIEVNLEMHGQFNRWRFARRAVEVADHPLIGIVYNCDPRDVIGGSVAATVDHVLPYIQHVHMHELSDPRYPHHEFIPMLNKLDYTGYLSAEIEPSSEPNRVLAYYSALFRAYLNSES